MDEALKPMINGRMYHIYCREGDIAPYVLLPGAPERSDLIAEFLEDARHIAKHREYNIYTGYYKGVPISTCSTGIGGPSLAIAVEELLWVGAKVFIRVGSSGSIRKEIRCGDLVISKAAVRMDGTSYQYAPEGYPASASPLVVTMLENAAKKLGFRYHVGITCTTDSFYVGQERPGFSGYLPGKMKGLIEELRKLNVFNFDMETATLFVLANIYNVHAGSICAVFANRVTGEFKTVGEGKAIRTALEAVVMLDEVLNLSER